MYYCTIILEIAKVTPEKLKHRKKSRNQKTQINAFTGMLNTCMLNRYFNVYICMHGLQSIQLRLESDRTKECIHIHEEPVHIS